MERRSKVSPLWLTFNGFFEDVAEGFPLPGGKGGRRRPVRLLGPRWLRPRWLGPRRLGPLQVLLRHRLQDLGPQRPHEPVQPEPRSRRHALERQPLLPGRRFGDPLPRPETHLLPGRVEADDWESPRGRFRPVHLFPGRPAPAAPHPPQRRPQGGPPLQPRREEPHFVLAAVPHLSLSSAHPVHYWHEGRTTVTLGPLPRIRHAIVLPSSSSSSPWQGR